jgi:hypothetical protein
MVKQTELRSRKIKHYGWMPDLPDEPLAEFISLREFNGIRGSGGTGVRLRLE